MTLGVIEFSSSIYWKIFSFRIAPLIVGLSDAVDPFSSYKCKTCIHICKYMCLGTTNTPGTNPYTYT